MWPFKNKPASPPPSKPRELDYWEIRDRDAIERAAGSPPNRIGVYNGAAVEYFYDEPSGRCIVNGTLQTWPDSVIEILDRDEDQYARMTKLLEAMLGSKKVKYSKVGMGMGGVYHSLVTWLDYGQQGPSLDCHTHTLSLTNGPSVYITSAESKKISDRMKAHGADPRVEIESIYALL